MDSLADCRFDAHICNGKRQHRRHRLCVGREQLGERAGQTQHRRGFDLRRHGATQLPPPLRADCLCTRHQAQSAVGFPFQRFALCDAGSCVGECFGDGHLRYLTSSDAPFAFQQAVARTPVNRVRG